MILDAAKKHGLEECIEAVLNAVDPLRHPEAVAYLFRQTMDAFQQRPDIHLGLLHRVPDPVVSRFAPGLLSAYFRVLKDCKSTCVLRTAAADAVEHVLCLDIVLSEESEKNIHDFFYFHRSSEFRRIYIVCAQKFRAERRTLFLRELLLLDHVLEDKEYTLLNRTIGEISLETVDKLLQIDRYENSDDVFECLVEMYRRGEDVGDIVSRIQRRFGIREVPELCPVDESTTREMLQTNNLARIKVFLKNADHVPIRTDVVKKCLELCESPGELEDCLGRFDIRRMVSEEYDELLEHAFGMMETNIRVLLNLMAIEFRPRMDELVFRSVDFVAQSGDAERIAQHLYFLKTVAEKRCLRRSVVRGLFDGIVYLDHSDCRVRCAKYEILSSILEQYGEMDRQIDAAGENPGAVDTDQDNVNVLVATAWDELNVVPVEDELVAVLLLLNKMVELTGTFLESRMTQSGFLLHLIGRQNVGQFSETRRRKMDVFLAFLHTIIRQFRLSKEVFGATLSLLLDYFHILGTRQLIAALAERDRYLCLYVIHRRRLSERLKQFLKTVL